jgi:hypothetical protein
MVLVLEELLVLELAILDVREMKTIFLFLNQIKSWFQMDLLFMKILFGQGFVALTKWVYGPDRLF